MEIRIWKTHKGKANINKEEKKVTDKQRAKGNALKTLLATRLVMVMRKLNPNEKPIFKLDVLFTMFQNHKLERLRERIFFSITVNYLIGWRFLFSVYESSQLFLKVNWLTSFRVNTYHGDLSKETLASIED